MERMLIQVIVGGTPWPGSCTLDGYNSGWSEIRGFSQEAVQDFSGSGSAGITAASGRINLNDVAIEKPVDEMSPLIFEHCSSGQGVDTVVIEIRTETNVKMTMVLDGGDGSTNFSKYKIIGDRYFPPVLQNEYSLNIPSVNTGGNLTGSTQKRKPAYTVTAKETFQLWFTRIRLQCGTTTRGWDGGKNCPDNTPIELTGGPTTLGASATSPVRTFVS